MELWKHPCWRPHPSLMESGGKFWNFKNIFRWLCGATGLKTHHLCHNIKCGPNTSSICFSWELLVCCSVTELCPTLCDPMDCLPVFHYHTEFAQTHAHWVGDAIQPSYPLLTTSPPALNLSQHQGLFQWVSSLHQGAKVLELQLQHQFFQWIFTVDFLLVAQMIKSQPAM